MRMGFLKQPRIRIILFGTVLVLFTLFVVLDTFVIPRSYASTEQSEGTALEESAGTITSSDSSYQDNNISITVTNCRQDNTTIYVAEITLADPSLLNTALAQNTFGKNVTETTSEMAKDNNAILAVNGDFYGAQNKGYVIRNGVLYRDTASSQDQEDLVIWSDGSFGIVKEGDVTAEELIEKGAAQVLSFGPGLVENGQITVSQNQEVDKAKVSNPRTAIGIIDNLHYVIVVSDGRTEESSGLSLYQLASYMQQLGVKTAYNLDGGGSSTLYFNGKVLNNPTSNGKSNQERSVSDIVYIGY